jgi:ABC-2 type transport system permease protein
MNGTLIEPSKDEMPHMVKPRLTPAMLDLAEDHDLLEIKRRGDTGRLLMPGVTGIAYSGNGPFKVSPLLMTAENTWLKAGQLVTDSTPPEYNRQEGDIRGSFATALALTRQVNNHQQRIVVCSDADFMSNLRGGGEAISRAFYSWMDEGAFPIYTPRAYAKDNLLSITTDGVSALKIIYTWVLPGLVLLLGSILLIRRKRK